MHRYVLKLAFIIYLACLISLSTYSQNTPTIVREYDEPEYSRLFKYSSAIYYSISPNIVINPSTTLVFLDAPSIVSTQLFILPGQEKQKLILIGKNVAGKLHIRNADAAFYFGNRDRWEAEFYSNKWIETSRTDL